jgi:RNA polymerase sigma-70 factor (ECF subfamily)
MKLREIWSSQERQHAAFERLIGPHLKRLYRLAYRYAGNRDDAEDLVQDLVIKLYPRLEELKRIDRPVPWLARVLYRQFIDNYRHRQRSPIDPLQSGEEHYLTHPHPGAGPSDHASQASIRRLLERALEHVKTEQRMLLLMHDAEGYGLEEISEIVDLPVGTIKSRLSRARHHLRQVIQAMEPDFVSDVLNYRDEISR